MMESNQPTPAEILRRLAHVLEDEECDPDDLIHAFGDVEQHRTDVAQLLHALLEQRHE